MRSDGDTMSSVGESLDVKERWLRRAARPCAAIAICFATCFVTWALTATPALAGTGTQFPLPPGNPAGAPGAAGGLILTVDCRWLQGYGHRPIEIRLTSQRRSPVDRLLTVEVGVGTWGDRNYVSVVSEILLPAGSKSVTQLLPVPQTASSDYLNIKTLEGGRLIEDLSVKAHPMSSGQFWGNASELPTALFIGPAAPDVSNFDFLVSAGYNAYGNSLSFSRLDDVVSFVHRKPDQLYDQWIYYSSLDLIFVSLDEARTLSKDRPEVWRAIADWTRCGGSLMLYGAPHTPEILAEIDQLLGTVGQGQVDTTAWQTPTEEQFESALLKVDEHAAAMQATQPQTDADGKKSGKHSKPKRPDKEPFQIKPVAFGQVVAIAAENPFPGDTYEWQWMFTAAEISDIAWAKRVGSSLDGGNPQFNEFLIADVGLPPIRTYRVLITLFVVLIGPVNYWMLRRAGRLHLFLFTVPLAALVTSAGLLSYALMSDGLSSRLRGRSLTYLDQTRDQATTQARLSYYLGLAPAGGLMFPQDALVVPLEIESVVDPRKRSREVVWKDHQQLSRGWLAARTPTQLQTLRAYGSEQGLDISPQPDGSLRIRNRLGVLVRKLLVCDEVGHWHFGKEIGPDLQISLERIEGEAKQAAQATSFGKDLTEYAPAIPDGMTGFEPNSGWFFFGNYARPYGAQDASGLNRLEVQLGKLRAEVLQRALKPRTYVAIVDRSEEVVVGVSGTHESESLHVIQGNW